MPNSPVRSLIAVCIGLAAMLVAALGLATSAGAATFPVDIRVLTADGKKLVDQRQYVAPLRAPTTPKANCFGQGTGGSGAKVELKGRTALGALLNAAAAKKALNPVLLTDHDFGFPGLGLCGIGKPTPAGQFWFLKTDHKNPQISGDQAQIKRGSSVLWFLMPFNGCDPNPPYACAPELVLKTPARARPGSSFKVRVTAFDDAGKEAPVEGAVVTGATEPTDAKGITEVRLDGPGSIVASKDGSVPSSPRTICVDEKVGRCAAAAGLRIVGSPAKDRIKGTPGPDIVHPRQGGGRVNVRGGGRDRVICLGPRHGDVVIADADDVVRRCKTVRRR